MLETKKGLARVPDKEDDRRSAVVGPEEPAAEPFQWASPKNRRGYRRHWKPLSRKTLRSTSDSISVIENAAIWSEILRDSSGDVPNQRQKSGTFQTVIGNR